MIGLVAALTLTPARVGMHPDLRIFLMVGVCGGFTTFSAFSLQTLELLQSWRWLAGGRLRAGLGRVLPGRGLVRLADRQGMNLLPIGGRTR